MGFALGLKGPGIGGIANSFGRPAGAAARV
jgi:hypothetical protein